jgi:hypothetical protein
MPAFRVHQVTPNAGQARANKLIAVGIIVALGGVLSCKPSGPTTVAVSPDSATFNGATYNTALGSANSFGCIYAFSVSGHLSLNVVDLKFADGALLGTSTDTMHVGVVLTSSSPTPGVTCNQLPYTATRTNNEVNGTYANLTSFGGDGFNSWNFNGTLVGNTLVGTLTINVTSYDLGGGNYHTFPAQVITGYVLTKQ